MFETLSKKDGPAKDRPWAFETYQAVLLNIIFDLYSGSERGQSRAALLCSLFITALRHMNFFSLETMEEQERVHFPGTFVPYRFVMRDTWKRVASCVFKADAYLCLLLNQPSYLHGEELDVPLPSTLALFNAHPLPRFFERLKTEPADRERRKLSGLTTTLHLPDPAVSSLAEDIQLGLCGLLPDIWRLAQLRHNGHLPGPVMQEALEEKLAGWKGYLETLLALCTSQLGEAQLATYPLDAYTGMEDPPGDNVEAIRRLASLVLDGKMLLHLLGMHLHANMRTIGLLTTGERENGDQAWLERLREWAISEDGRKAVTHAHAALRAYKEGLERGGDGNRRKTHREPAARIASTKSLAVIRAWSWAVQPAVLS